MAIHNKIFIALCALILPLVGRAQINFVLNPSFEDYSNCPDNIDEAKYCNSWMSLDTAWSPPDWAHAPLGVPEYDNICATYSRISVPSSLYYSHFPRTGNCMMQVQMYYNNSDVGQARDYLQGTLSRTLDSSHAYYVKFYTTLAQASAYAVNHIGAYFDGGVIDTTHNPGATQGQYTPQIVSTSIINDTLHWVKIEGIFNANGKEKFVTIGNFSDRAHTSTISFVGATTTDQYSWYLIDDVSVLDCSSEPYAGHDTLIHPGDSAFIGPHESLLPYRWFALGGAAPIDSGGGIWVRPTATTTYVLEQNLCGRVRYDTIKVRVWPDTVAEAGNLQMLAHSLQLSPNPTKGIFTLAGAEGFEIGVYDIVGRQAWHCSRASAKEIIDISGFPTGLYTLQITDKQDGGRLVRKVYKE